MKTIGLVGGMSWQSSALYYQLINQETKRRLGGHHNARSLMHTVDFAEIEACQRAGDWRRTAAILTDAARSVERGGADCVVLCTTTMHIVADEISAAVSIPLIHIVDVTAAAIRAAGQRRVGLLATEFTMSGEFYRARMRARGVEIIVPSQPDRELVHRIIYDELCHGVIRPESRAAYCETVAHLAMQGAEAVVLGCTEVELLLRPEDVAVPLHASSALHAAAAVQFALADPAP